MRRIRILYFSAVGGTRVAAELLAELLAPGTGPSGRAVSVASIEDDGARALAAEADFLVLCFPTYYLKPAPPMRDFAAGLGPFSPTKPCYLVATCELYSENSSRHLAGILLARGLAPVGWKTLRAPGSDVTAVLPAGAVPWLYRFGRGFGSSLRTAAAEIAAGAAVDGAAAEPVPGRRPPAGRIPPPRWYTLLTQLLQVAALNHFDLIKYRLRALDGRCTLCGLCVAECPAGALSLEAGRIRIEAERCMLCCRCIHGCPERAMVLLERLKDNRRIDAALLAALKAEAKDSLALPARPAGVAAREAAEAAAGSLGKERKGT